MNNCSHICTLTMEAISVFDSLTTCSKRVVADLVESRSEKFEENEKKNGLDTESSQSHLYLCKVSTLWLVCVFRMGLNTPNN